MPERPILLVLSDVDPVASAVAARWGESEGTGWTVDGAQVRRLSPGLYTLRRPGRHIHDERLDARLPGALVAAAPTLVFPSVHRSSQNVRAFTVHPLGNPGPGHEVGGAPRTLVPTDPELMARTLRSLTEVAAGGESVVTFEATHHGPALGLPAFFAEIGFAGLGAPPAEEVELLSRVLHDLARDDEPLVPALAVGGGHYAPHFTDLAQERRWAFGHILSKHALVDLDRPTAEAALRLTPGARGIVYARAADGDGEALRGLAPRLRDQDAPKRGP